MAAASVSPAPYRRMGLMSSSLPPSSPCQNANQDDPASPDGVTSAVGDDDEGEILATPGTQSKAPASPVEVATVVDTRGQKPAADGGENEAPADKPKRKRESKKKQPKSKKAVEAAEDAEAAEGSGDDAKAAEDADGDDKSEGSGDEAQGAAKKRGRLSKEVKAKALAIRQRYDQDLEALALQSGKTVASLLEAVGEVVPEGRALNKWNAFQSYAVHQDGYGMVKKEEQSIVEFKKEIHDLYNVKVEEADGELEDIVEWYKVELAAQTADKHNAGYTVKELEKFTSPFINRVCLTIVNFHGD